jgi:hypothetical protein
MRQISLLIVFSVMLVCSCDTEGNVDPIYQTYFIKYYGEDGNQEGVDLLVNADGSMILLGNSSSQTNPVTIPFIVKIDPFGTVLWQRQFGELNEKAVDVETDNAGNLIIVSNSGEGDATRVKVYQISQGGDDMASIKVELGEMQVAKSVSIMSDGRIFVPGYAAPKDSRNTDPAIIHSLDKADVIILDVDLQAQEFEVISPFRGGEYEGAGVKVFEDANGYDLCGYTDRRYESLDIMKRFELLELNESASAEGARVVFGNNSEYQIASSFIETSGLLGDAYFMVGTTYNNANPLLSTFHVAHYYKPLDTKMPPRFQFPLLLSRRLEGVSGAASETEGFYVLGNDIRDNNKRDIFLVKLASDGAVLGSVAFGALEGDDSAGAVRVLPDGRVAVLGTMELETQKKIALIVLDSDGRL